MLLSDYFYSSSNRKEKTENETEIVWPSGVVYFVKSNLFGEETYDKSDDNYDTVPNSCPESCFVIGIEYIIPPFVSWCTSKKLNDNETLIERGSN